MRNTSGRAEDDEAFRLAELASLGVLDTPPEPKFDELVRLAATIAETPIALISLIDAERQWFKAKLGLEGSETARNISFCTHAVAQRELLVVPDAQRDFRFCNNPSVVGEPQVRFYAGAPLISTSGAVLGTLCVIDRVPRELSEGKLDALRILSRQVVAQLELARAERARRVAESASKVLGSQLDEVTRRGNIGLWDWDLRTNTVAYRGNWAAMLGYSSEELTLDRNSWLTLLHPDDRGKVLEALDEHLAGRTSAYQVEHRTRPQDGSYRWILSQGAVVERDAHGNALRMTGVRIDITDRKTMEQELAQSARLASVGTLAAGVAHEINNPLTFVLGNISVAQSVLTKLKDDAVSSTSAVERALDALQDASYGAQRVCDVVRDLHALTRPDEDAGGPLDLIDVIESSINMARHELRHRARLERRYELRPSLVGNAGRLGQLFVNLLVNAAQAIPEGDADHHLVTVRLHEGPGEHILIDVTDTGVGIPEDVLPHVFDPFFTTKAQHMGTGLGLAICRRVAESHGGQISATSTPGGGTTIRVRLPLHGVSRGNNTHRKPSPLPASQVVHEAMGLRHRVLVVDDEPAVGRIVRRFLESAHDVFVEESAAKALSRVASGEEFDMILCDLMMPAMTGREFHLQLAATSPHLADRVVFVTGGTRDALSSEFRSLHGNRLLEKPFSSAALVSALLRSVRRAAQGVSETREPVMLHRSREHEQA